MNENKKENLTNAKPVPIETTPTFKEFSPLMLIDHFISDDNYGKIDDKDLRKTVDKVNSINKEFSQALNISQEYIENIYNNGFVSLSDNTIDSTGNPVYGCIIPGQAYLQNGSSYPVYVMNTINRGFRFISIGPNNMIVDNGPVRVPVVIGSPYAPYGMYVPFDYKAVRFAADIFDTALFNYETVKKSNGYIDVPNYIDEEASRSTSNTYIDNTDNDSIRENNHYEEEKPVYNKKNFYWTPKTNIE